MRSLKQKLATKDRDSRYKVSTAFQHNCDLTQGFIKFDYDTNVITVNVNKFGNGNAQFSVGMGVKKMVCPDPFMGKLSDPNMNR